MTGSGAFRRRWIWPSSWRRRPRGPRSVAAVGLRGAQRSPSFTKGGAEEAFAAANRWIEFEPGNAEAYAEPRWHTPFRRRARAGRRIDQKGEAPQSVLSLLLHPLCRPGLFYPASLRGGGGDNCTGCRSQSSIAAISFLSRSSLPASWEKPLARAEALAEIVEGYNPNFRSRKLAPSRPTSGRMIKLADRRPAQGGFSGMMRRSNLRVRVRVD